VFLEEFHIWRGKLLQRRDTEQLKEVRQIQMLLEGMKVIGE